MDLQAALTLVEAEGLPNVFARHRLLAQAVQAAVAGWAEGGALDFFVRDAAVRSVSVTTIAVRPGIDSEALRRLARERFQVGLAGGLGSLAGRIFRIGHLGDLNAPMELGCLAGVEAALQGGCIDHRPTVARDMQMLGRTGPLAGVRMSELSSVSASPYGNSLKECEPERLIAWRDSMGMQHFMEQG